MDLCLLCTRLRNSYGQHARGAPGPTSGPGWVSHKYVPKYGQHVRGGPSAIKNKRALDIPSFAVTRRLLAAARMWLMMRVPLQEFRIPPRYVESLRAQFMRMFLDFVVGVDKDEGGKGVASRRNIEIRPSGEGQVPAIIFPGGPNFHAYSEMPLCPLDEEEEEDSESTC